MTCPACQIDLTADEVLDAGTVALPEAAILVFRCPSCAGEGWARLGTGAIAVGAPAAGAERFAPGPDHAVPDLSVRPEGAWLDCWHAGRYRRYPARATPAR